MAVRTEGLKYELQTTDLNAEIMTCLIVDAYSHP